MCRSMRFSIILNHWARKSTVIWIIWRAGRLWPGLPQTDREGGKTTLRLETDVLTRLRQHWDWCRHKTEQDMKKVTVSSWGNFMMQLMDLTDEPDGNCVDAARCWKPGSVWDYLVSFPALWTARVVQSFWLFCYFYALYIVCVSRATVRH